MSNGEVVFIDRPIEVSLVGDNVLAEVHSGGSTIRFAMPVPLFMESFAKAGLVAHDWRSGRDNVIPLRGHAAT